MTLHDITIDTNGTKKQYSVYAEDSIEALKVLLEVLEAMEKTSVAEWVGAKK